MKKSPFERITGFKFFTLFPILCLLALVTIGSAKAAESVSISTDATHVTKNSLSEWRRMGPDAAVLYEDDVGIGKIHCIGDKQHWEFYLLGEHKTRPMNIVGYQVEDKDGAAYSNNGIAFRLYRSDAFDRMIARLEQGKDVEFELNTRRLYLPNNGFKEVVMPIVMNCRR